VQTCNANPQPGMITTALIDQPPVLIVQEEEPLQLRTRRLLRERPVRLGLLIGKNSTDTEPNR
jgi:hypothetical protein